MELAKVLDTNLIAVNCKLSSKKEVLQKIAELSAGSPHLVEYSAEDIFWALDEREKLSSTGFGNGIAIPHCTLDCRDFVIGALSIPEGVEFDAIDGEPVKIVVFIIAPENGRDLHIRYLSALSGMLNDELNRTKILAASDSQALHGIFIRHTQMPEVITSSNSWTQFTFIIQSEEIFDRILGILTEIEDSSIAVLDANSAGYYLYSKPLFASLWGNPVDNYCKIILATLPRRLANEILRRSNNLIDKEFPQGLIVTMQELDYLAGKLNI